MCLLIQQTKDTNFTDEHLLDFYTRNKDGIGVMWAEDGKLFSDKLIPKTAQESVDFYNRVARGKDCCVHYRMRTHGAIDHENTHPYEVFGFTASHEMPMLLMHNGILHTSNRADETKSDTWHYIRDYLHRLLDGNPALAFDPVFEQVISKHIGNNRFALMNHLGQTVIFNKAQGVSYNGAWMSNTYAWSADKWMPRPTTPTYYTSNYGKGGVYTPPKSVTPAKVAKVSKAGKAGNRSSKKAQDLTTPTGGQLFSPTTPITQAERKIFNGIPVESQHLDDILDIRGTLEAVYLTNQTSNRQISAMIDEMGVITAYFAVELLSEGMITEKEWDSLSGSRVNMREFAKIPQSHWYSNKAMKRTKEYFQ